MYFADNSDEHYLSERLVSPQGRRTERKYHDK